MPAKGLNGIGSFNFCEKEKRGYTLSDELGLI
jgi:hypothetical protein